MPASTMPRVNHGVQLAPAAPAAAPCISRFSKRIPLPAADKPKRRPPLSWLPPLYWWLKQGRVVSERRDSGWPAS